MQEHGGSLFSVGAWSPVRQVIAEGVPLRGAVILGAVLVAAALPFLELLAIFVVARVLFALVVVGILFLRWGGNRLLSLSGSLALRYSPHDKRVGGFSRTSLQQG